jgi:DNA invertase Pin-like site-specific DNA recombinase
MGVIGYIRVSTEEQSREGVSLDMQRAKITTYCDLHDLELVEIVEDAGISGKTISARPGIQHVLDMVRRKKITGIVIYKLDRLARNAREALEIAELLQKKGCELHSITETLNTGSASGRMFYGILATMAQWERETIAERTCAALSRKRERGEKTGGDCPFGYTVTEDGHLIENPVEQAHLRRIHELHREGYSIRDIVAALKEEGITTRKGSPWGKTMIHRVLQRVKAA